MNKVHEDMQAEQLWLTSEMTIEEVIIRAESARRIMQGEGERQLLGCMVS